MYELSNLRVLLKYVKKFIVIYQFRNSHIIVIVSSFSYRCVAKMRMSAQYIH